MTQEERNKKVEENLKLVTFSLKKLGVGFNEDYFQQGVLELIRCVNNYNENKGTKFSTYAVKNIKLYLKEYIARDKVLKPKRYGGTANIYAPPCDSLEKVIYNAQGNDIKLLDVINYEGNKNMEVDKDEFMWDLQLLVDKGLLTQNHLDAVLLTYRDGYNRKQISEKLKIGSREIKKLLDEALLIIRSNLSYNNYDRR